MSMTANKEARVTLNRLSPTARWRAVQNRGHVRKGYARRSALVRQRQPHRPVPSRRCRFKCLFKRELTHEYRKLTHGGLEHPNNSTCLTSGVTTRRQGMFFSLCCRAPRCWLTAVPHEAGGPVLCLIANGSGAPRLPPRKQRAGYVGHAVVTTRRWQLVTAGLQHDIHAAHALTNSRGRQDHGMHRDETGNAFHWLCGYGVKSDRSARAW
jgi:hypothetical protein